jgi:hypothetical protein
MLAGEVCGSGGVAIFDGRDDEVVLVDGDVRGDSAVATVEAGFEEIGEGVEDEGGDLIAGGDCEKAMKVHVGGDGVPGCFGVYEMLVGVAEGDELFFGGEFGGEAGVFGLDGESEFEELAEAVEFVGNEEVEGVGEGFMQAVDGVDAETMTNFEEALLLKAFGGLPDDAAADTEFGGKFALGGEAGVFFVCVTADECGEALGDLFDKGGGAVDGVEGHHDSSGGLTNRLRGGGLSSFGWFLRGVRWAGGFACRFDWMESVTGVGIGLSR